MLSKPRKPPSNRFDPSASCRFTHQVKFRRSLENTRVRNVRSRRPSISNTCSAAHACTGGLRSSKVLVGGDGAVGMLKPFAAEQDQLVLRERGVQVRQRYCVERRVPRGEPGVLPRVRHRHHVVSVQVTPVRVASVLPSRRRGRLSRVAGEPAGDVVAVELLSPDHPGEALTHDHGVFGAGTCRCQLGVERVRFGAALRQHLVEGGAEDGGVGRGRRGQPQRQFRGSARVHRRPGTRTPLSCPPELG